MSAQTGVVPPRDIADLGAEAETTRQKADAARAVAWLIIVNKPFYPFYIWWLTGAGLGAAFLTAASTPLYLAALMLAKRDTRWVRVGVPVLGMADTAFATKLLGGASGVELFAVPCALLIALAFAAREAGLVRVLAALLGGSVILLHTFNVAYFPLWDAGQSAGLLTMHVFSSAAMSLFILFRFTRPV